MILLEFLLQRSGNFLFYIKHHSGYSNPFSAYIDCCVLIPVHSISACTLINAITQLQIFFYVSTAAAGFGTGIPAVNTDPFLPGTFHSDLPCTRYHRNWLSSSTPYAKNPFADVRYGYGSVPLSSFAFYNGYFLVRSGSVYAAPLPASSELLRKNEDMLHDFHWNPHITPSWKNQDQSRIQLS